MRAGGLIAREASAFDLLEALDDLGGRARVTRMRFGQMARQVSAGPSVAIREASGLLVAVAGLWPEVDHRELWMATGPAFRRNLRGGLVALDAHLTAAGEVTGGGEVRVYVRAGDHSGGRVAGARMAGWLGFDRIGAVGSPLGPVEVFSRILGGPPDGVTD